MRDNMTEGTERPEEYQSPLGTGIPGTVRHLMKVLGTKLGSFTIVCALIH